MSQPSLSASDSSTRRELFGLGAARMPRLRDPSNHPLSRRTRRAKAFETAPTSILALHRLGFGPRPGDVAAFQALGGGPAARLAAWVDQQLDPASLDDSELDAKIAAGGFTTLGKSRAQLWVQHKKNSSYSERIRPRDEVERATFLRAIYSRRQLFEVMVNFWHDHFNVYSYDSWPSSMFVHYDRDVIRANALGNFRLMLGSVAKSTSMLYYLDNYTSTNAGPNENFSRELFELHTLGSENYLGIGPQHAVPTENGVPIGYVDADVFESTRAFTGWTVASDSSTGDNGEFYYRDEWHDRFQKTVLGTFMPQDQPPMQDGRDVLDALAFHPGTARHVCRKICRRLTVDEPPQSLVDAAVATWRANASELDQIARVVRTIATAPEFLEGWGEKAKRPFEVAVSAMRAVGTKLSFAMGDSETDTFLSRFDACGQPLFAWPTPDGFPDRRAAWQSVAPRAMTWRFCLWAFDQDNDNDQFFLDVLAKTPPSVRSAAEIVDFWVARLLGRAIDPADREELVAFMSQGLNPDLDLPLDSETEVQERLRTLAGLICNTPYFLWK